MAESTTQLRNTELITEIFSFTIPEGLPPVHNAQSLYKHLQQNGPLFLQTDAGKALLHALNKAAFGENYRIEGRHEQLRLENALPELRKFRKAA